MDPETFLDHCSQSGFQFFSGTPCSYLKPLINVAIDDPEIQLVDATNEGDAVAMTAGAYVAGKKGVVMFQNSGLGNAVNALTSLCWPFRIPMLMIVTHRAQPGGVPDEPQHELMGQITTNLLEMMNIRWESFPQSESELTELFARIQAHMDAKDLPFALVLPTGVLQPKSLKKPMKGQPIGLRQSSFEECLTRNYSERVTRTDALKVLLKHRTSSDVLIATTGFTGRELFTLEDVDQHFYMVGSMGSASSFSLGVSLHQPNRRVITIDGDGAALMRMGNMASIGAYKPSNYVHLLLDNEAHDSTGGQQTVSGGVSFAAIAKGCGYAQVYSSDDLKDLAQWLAESGCSGPTFIHFRTKKGTPPNLPRPSVKPVQVKERFMKFLKS